MIFEHLTAETGVNIGCFEVRLTAINFLPLLRPCCIKEQTSLQNIVLSSTGLQGA